MSRPLESDEELIRRDVRAWLAAAGSEGAAALHHLRQRR